MNQHVVQRLPGNGDAKSVHAGEVRQADPTRHVLLAEYNLLLGTMTRLPITDATFQGAPDAWIQLGVTLQQFFEQTDRTNPWMGLQNRDHIGFKKTTQRVWLSPPPQGFLLGRKPRILVDPVSGSSAETSLRRSDLSGVVFFVYHERPHLVISNMTSGHLALLCQRIVARLLPEQPHLPRGPKGNYCSTGLQLQSGTALPPLQADKPPSLKLTVANISRLLTLCNYRAFLPALQQF